MNPDASVANKMSGLDQLFLDSALAGFDEEAPPSQIETVLRCVPAPSPTPIRSVERWFVMR